MQRSAELSEKDPNLWALWLGLVSVSSQKHISKAEHGCRMRFQILHRTKITTTLCSHCSAERSDVETSSKSCFPPFFLRPSWHFSFNLLPLFQEIRRAVTWNLFEELGCCGGYAYRRSSVSYNTLWFCAFSPATLPLPTWVPSVLIPLTLS